MRPLLLLLLFASVLPVRGQKIYLDLGRNDGVNGLEVPAPTGAEARWNNLSSAAQAVPAGLSLANLVFADGSTSDVSVVANGSWQANGIQNGGLLNPDPALLDELARAEATHDYFFVTSTVSGELRFSGLTPGKTYRLQLFGSRVSALSTRVSHYQVSDDRGSFERELTTTGEDIGADGEYDGNDSEVVEFLGLIPDSSGELVLEVSVDSGGFAYLNALSLEEVDSWPEIDRWVAQDRLAPHDPGALLFIGSSSIRRWENLVRDFGDYRVIQRGFGGSQLEHLVEFADRIILPYQPSGIVIWSGTNDLSTGETATEVFTDLQNLMAIVRASLPTVPVFYLGVTPTQANGPTTAERDSFNQQVAAYAAGEADFYYVDLPTYFYGLDQAEFDSLYVDPLHLNEAGYDEWRKLILPVVESVLPPNRAVEANLAALAAGEQLLFDFGPSNPEDGEPTQSPDGAGLHWNNWHPASGQVAVNSGERITNLVDSTGRATGIDLLITGGFLSNGIINGGLDAPDGPDPALLGELAVESATRDYFYSTADGVNGGGSDDVPGGFVLENLDPGLAYRVKLFGSRSWASTRRTEFDLLGAGAPVSGVLQTSGENIGSDGIYDGNDSEILTIEGLTPDRFGRLFIDMTLVEGGFAYLNAMLVEATAPTSGVEAWGAQYFSAADYSRSELEPLVWGDGADPDGDGVRNLLEYALGRNPTFAEPGGQAGGSDLQVGVASSGEFVLLDFAEPFPLPPGVNLRLFGGPAPDQLNLLQEGDDFQREVLSQVPGTVNTRYQVPADQAAGFFALGATRLP